MEAICSSETSVDYQRTTWHYIPDDSKTSVLASSVNRISITRHILFCLSRVAKRSFPILISSCSSWVSTNISAHYVCANVACYLSRKAPDLYSWCTRFESRHSSVSPGKRWDITLIALWLLNSTSSQIPYSQYYPIIGPYIFIYSPPCACRGSIGQNPQCGGPSLLFRSTKKAAWIS
jgi:hypothetical protein